MPVSDLAPPDKWDEEYRRQGIPSSWKVVPSTVVAWAVANYTYAAGRELSPGSSVVDMGCGTGRNSVALAERGCTVQGFDYAAEAIDIARARPTPEGPGSVEFHVMDARDGIPLADQSVDLMIDTFVYFHLLRTQERIRVRQEISRVLTPGGLLLTSLALSEDGFYATCEDMPAWAEFSEHRIVVDATAGIGNILLSRGEAGAEWSDCLELVMSWDKTAVGPMHGGIYRRHTFAGLWRLPPKEPVE